MGEWQFGSSTFEILRGNLAEQSVDGTVIDVGLDWLPKGPASGNLFRTAGSKLQEHVQNTQAKRPGDVYLTPGFDFPTDNILLCALEQKNEVDDLESILSDCYKSLLENAESEGLSSIALPPLGLGDFDYPIDTTSKIAIKRIQSHLSSSSGIRNIRLVVYDAIEYSSVDNFGQGIIEGNNPQKDAEQKLRDYY